MLSLEFSFDITPAFDLGIEQSIKDGVDWMISLRRHRTMSSNRQRVIRRRIGSSVCGLLGLWLVANAVGPHVDGLRERHIEYMQNIPVFVILSMIFLVVGGALLSAAWKLWRAPED